MPVGGLWSVRLSSSVTAPQVELKTGETYRGTLVEAEDNWNSQMKDITVTGRVRCERDTAEPALLALVRVSACQCLSAAFASGVLTP